MSKGKWNEALNHFSNSLYPFFPSIQTQIHRLCTLCSRSIGNWVYNCQLCPNDWAETPRANQPHRRACLTDLDFQILGSTSCEDARQHPGSLKWKRKIRRSIAHHRRSSQHRETMMYCKSNFSLYWSSAGRYDIPAKASGSIPSRAGHGTGRKKKKMPDVLLHGGKKKDLLCRNFTDILIHPSRLPSIFCMFIWVRGNKAGRASRSPFNKPSVTFSWLP